MTQVKRGGELCIFGTVGEQQWDLLTEEESSEHNWEPEQQEGDTTK